MATCSLFITYYSKKIGSLSGKRERVRGKIRKKFIDRKWKCYLAGYNFHALIGGGGTKMRKTKFSIPATSKHFHLYCPN